jgi:protein-S-isoprenylcysteine O-methyltransferase Ste14
MPAQLKILLFILGSIPILWISRAPLKDARSHGFYRTFAWEADLALVVINLDAWFTNPFSWYQIISWTLLIISIIWVVAGVRLLRMIGKPDEKRVDDPALVSIEKTTELVTVGVFRFIRHPLYSSLLFLAWGVFFKQPSWIGFALASVATCSLTITGKIEESENTCYFGSAYQEYMQKTKMFIPFIF